MCTIIGHRLEVKMSEKKEEERQTATGYIMQEEHIAYSRHHFLSQNQTIQIKGLYVIVKKFIAYSMHQLFYPNQHTIQFK
jgi:hypothetical protein